MFDLKFFQVVKKILSGCSSSGTIFPNDHQYIVSSKKLILESQPSTTKLYMSQTEKSLLIYISDMYPSYFGLALKYGAGKVSGGCFWPDL